MVARGIGGANVRVIGGTNMAVKGVVYDSPRTGVPALMVIFHNGEVLVARAASSVAEAEKLLAKIMQEFHGERR